MTNADTGAGKCKQEYDEISRPRSQIPFQSMIGAGEIANLEGQLHAELKLAQTFEDGCSTTKIALASLDDSGLVPRRQGIMTYGTIDVYDGNVRALFSKSNCGSSANTTAGARNCSNLIYKSHRSAPDLDKCFRVYYDGKLAQRWTYFFGHN